MSRTLRPSSCDSRTPGSSQWVIAIGNPFGLDRTVTAGIVSATARTRVGVATYENFIQTDASINPGNSGGPLLNLDGKVVGINTAIVASGQGIGFAIPANMARDVMKQLIAGGRVVRGWLGIVIQDVTDELASSFGVRERQGVLIADVMKGGPAEVAGVRAGDVVVQFAGETVREVPELQRRVAAVTPGQSVTLVVVRDEARLPMTVAVAEMPTDEPAAARSDAMWGLTIEPLPADDPATLLGRSFSRGVVITEVAPGSAAERAGLQRGDIILAEGPDRRRRRHVLSRARRAQARQRRAAVGPPRGQRGSRQERVRRARATAPAMKAALAENPAAVRRGTVLVVDDEDGVRASVRAILEETCDVIEAEDGGVALDVLRAREVDVVMLDQRMPGEPGIEVLARIKALDPTIVVILATAVRDVRTAVAAMRLGAYDYLVKPFDVDDLNLLVQRALEKRALEREVLCLRSALAPSGWESANAFEGLVGRHAEMVRIYQLITQLAETTTTVLITGESGTGKELVARAIHRRSPRRDQPFVAVNVAAIPDTLIESELFGHERGAFTGAHARKLGKFELAHGGTVFLDEIGSLRLDLQTRLLRVLQEREVERIGGVRPIPVDVRVLAATNVNLRMAVRQRAFRDDLFYRLNVVPIDVPPLRQRRDDIPILVEHFVRKIARECNRDVRSITAGALETLVRYDWPGNVRELQNVIHRAVVLAREPVLQMHDIPLDLALPETGVGLTEDTGLPLREACDQFERQYVLRVLESVRWNVSRGARRLGVHRNTVLTKLAGWGIHRPTGADGRSASL
ncbi:MAG: hypothetical protein DME08_03710 [Candidatus Rokuibacteriota bacterium]|nr:MAG: hypothetical protein DME08_03710 [Candidatus Rokubacteria bacterium]